MPQSGGPLKFENEHLVLLTNFIVFLQLGEVRTDMDGWSSILYILVSKVHSHNIRKGKYLGYRAHIDLYLIFSVEIDV